MRDIRFRGLRVDGKGWVYGSFLKELYNSYIVECVDQTRYAFTNISVIPESVGQFTGLTDKNGKEIYEGDILSHHDYSKGACLTFEQFKRTSNIVIDNLFDGIRLYGMGGTYTKKDKESFEIIGNIHEQK